MKLPNFYDFESLIRLKSRMGISRDVYGAPFRKEIVRGRITTEELDILTNGQGLDVKFDQLTILPDGTLAYKDNRVLLHIRDVHAVSKNQDLPKYHLKNCTTLISMTESGRFNRYVISATVNGIFSIRIITDNKPQSQQAQLHVCRYCLHELQLNGYDSKKLTRQQKDQVVKSFVPDDFFAYYPQSLFSNKPIYDSDSAPLNVYTPDWPQISLNAREYANWRCQDCCIDLSTPHLRKYLHTHHKNGQRNDNTFENLRVLCIKCHAGQPNHDHIKKSQAYKAFQSVKLPLHI